MSAKCIIGKFEDNSLLNMLNLFFQMNMLAALNNNSFEHLSNSGNFYFEVLNEILRAFRYRELVRTSPLFDLICDRYYNLRNQVKLLLYYPLDLSILSFLKK